MELAERGYCDGAGVLLGTVSPPSWWEAAKFLLTAPWWQSERACRLGLFALARRAMPVSFDRGTHTVIFAPSGAGKTTAHIIPLLLTCDDNCFVIDIKGELAKATMAARQDMGHHCVLLDPFHHVARDSDSFNPVDIIDPQSPHALDDVRAMAEAVVIRTGEEKDPHWPDSAESYVAGLTAFVLSEIKECSLQSVTAILNDDVALAGARVSMRKSKAFGGHLARMGGQLSHYKGDELASVLTTTNRHLRFLNTPAIENVTSISTFDMRKLVTGRMTIYVVVPPDKLESLSGWMRLLVTAATRVLAQGGLNRDRTVRFVLDEAAALGRMSSIDAAISQLRGYGLKCLFAYQSMGQLTKVYGDGQDQTFLSNMDCQIFNSINDIKTAEYVSPRLGNTTVVNRTTNGGDQVGVNYDPSGMASRSYSRTTGFSAQEGGRSLLDPSEVMRLPSRTSIVFAPNVDPFLTTQLRHYEPAFAQVLRPLSGRAVVRKCHARGLLALPVALLLLAVVRAGPSAPRDGLVPATPARPGTGKTLEAYAREGERKAREKMREFEAAAGRGEVTTVRLTPDGFRVEKSPPARRTP